MKHVSSAMIATALAMLAASTAGCRYIDYHPYDVEVSGPTDINGVNSRLIEVQCAGRDTIRFVATGDTQGWYDDTRDFVRDVNKRDSIDFVVHMGDLSDYGTMNEFKWQRNLLGKLRCPYVVDIGNHDCLGTGKQSFQKIFGATDFSFIAGRVKFVMLNTNSLEYDYSVAVPDFDFISKQDTARAGEFSRTIVTMHAHPFSDVFNNNVANSFEFFINRLPGLMFCLNGHDHTMLQKAYFDDGLLYFQTSSIDHRTYYLFTVTPQGYTYEIIDF